MATSFNPSEDCADAALLFEATGYQSATQKQAFWQDFFDNAVAEIAQKDLQLTARRDGGEINLAFRQPEMELDLGELSKRNYSVDQMVVP